MGRKVASTGCAAVSAEGLPSADGKKVLPAAARLPSAEGKIFFIFPLDRFVLLYYYHSTT